MELIAEIYVASDPFFLNLHAMLGSSIAQYEGLGTRVAKGTLDVSSVEALKESYAKCASSVDLPEGRFLHQELVVYREGARDEAISGVGVCDTQLNSWEEFQQRSADEFLASSLEILQALARGESRESIEERMRAFNAGR